MDLLYSVLVLFLIAMIWTGIIFLVFKKIIGRQIKRDKSILLGGLLLFIAMMAIVVAGTAAFEYIESPSFCGTFCHIMEPYYEPYLRPGINSMMSIHVSNGTSCSNCHDEPGLVGKIEGLLRSIPEAYLYYTNTYDPEDLGGKTSREMCLKCHDGIISNIPSYVETVAGTIVNPHSDEKICTECHNFHDKGFGLKDNTCSICHGTNYDNFEAMLLDHGERSGTDCWECHNRKHPDDALIPFSEYPKLKNEDFCSDCHEDEVKRLSTGEHESEDCFVCHIEHSALRINFNNCLDSCHTLALGHDETTSSCSICHITSSIHLKPGYDSGELFSDIICADCHVSESLAYESSYTPDSLKIYGDNGCIDCHYEHEAIIYPHQITSPFDDCGSCHSTYDKPSTVHDRTGISYLGFLGITKEFCSDCHSEEVKSLSRELHNSYECIECHEDHDILLIDYSTCESCHSIPADHDSSLTTCVDSGCHDNIRSIHS